MNRCIVSKSRELTWRVAGVDVGSSISYWSIYHPLRKGLSQLSPFKFLVGLSACVVGFCCPDWIQNCSFMLFHIPPKTRSSLLLSGDLEQKLLSVWYLFLQMTPLWRCAMEGCPIALIWQLPFQCCLQVLTQDLLRKVGASCHHLFTYIRARHNPPHHYIMFAQWHEEGCPNTV